ncbi:MAG: hypothetical protein PHT12_03665 [Patescibacteria group bacterium]|nr:hypothetical protein [Patescibacteria group bacterium]
MQQSDVSKGSEKRQWFFGGRVRPVLDPYEMVQTGLSAGTDSPVHWANVSSFSTDVPNPLGIGRGAGEKVDSGHRLLTACVESVADGAVHTDCPECGCANKIVTCTFDTSVAGQGYPYRMILIACAHCRAVTVLAECLTLPSGEQRTLPKGVLPSMPHPGR